MTDPDCPRCDGFGWVPKGEEAGWYQRDWRLMLDPTITWRHCPRCGSPEPTLARLQDHLSRLLIRKLEAQAVDWRTIGSWRCGRMPRGRVLYRWSDLVCLSPDPDDPTDGWMVISPRGILRRLDAARCAYHLEQAGAPTLP